MQGLELATRLFAAMETRPSYHGTREDKKICHAKPGECRFNNQFYTLGMGDAKSWSLPIADRWCGERCPYLKVANNQIQRDPKKTGG